MWIPADERRVLSGYYELIGAIDTEKVYKEDNLTELLAPRPCFHNVKCYGNSGDSPADSESMQDMERFQTAVNDTVDRLVRLKLANKMLVARNLILVRRHENVSGVVLVGMTVSGYDLGRRYRSFWDRSGLWFEAYSHHWMWLILTFLGGILASSLVNWLS